MIKFRHYNFEESISDIDYQILEDESIESAVNRIVEHAGIEEDPKEIFHVILNGHKIESAFWHITVLKPTDSIVIAPLLQGDDSGSALRTILTIAVIAGAAYFTAPLLAAGGFSAVGGAALNAAAAVVAGILANQLFPPPVPAGQGPYDNGSYNDSQMYSISSQQNVAKKFGSVPRVYGTHRMFPLVAAQPYTELEVDPTTGKTVQYFYCVYDFGIGPNIISDIKIGDTPLSSFSDVTTRLVDFNKPVASPETSWDSAVSDHLELYKSEQQVESIGVTINGNQQSGGPLDTYQITRNGPENPDLVNQQFTLNFVAQNGLYAFNAQGTRGPRIIDLDIFFSKQGEDVWLPYNDSNYVSTYQSIGGIYDGSDRALVFPPVNVPLNINSQNGLQQLYPSSEPVITEMKDGQPYRQVVQDQLGFVPGQTFFMLPLNCGLLPGDVLKVNGEDIGTVGSVQSPFFFDRDRINLVSPITKRIKFFDYYTYTYLQNPPFGVQVVQIVSVLAPGAFLYKKGSPLGRLTISANTQESHFASLRFTPKNPGEYKFRITRLRTRSQFTTTVQDNLLLNSLSTRFDASPINTLKRHTFLEIRIKATGQLNGTIQNLSALVTSVLNVWNGSTWELAPTNNPAWVFADILCGEINKRPLSLTQLDTQSLTTWSLYCDQVPTSGALYTFVEKRFTCNFILDYNTTVQNIISQVASSAQASLNLINGKYGVLLDVNQDIPVQIFTPRNSTGFSSQKSFHTNPDGLKVSYIDPNSNWQPNEIIVYNDGFDETNAEVFEEMQSFACTQIEQAWRFGRYFLAQHILRQETITLKVDFEYLVCTRGDFVQITQDVMKVGGRPARVKSVSGNQVTIDDAIESGPLSYGYTFRRSSDGLVFTNTLTINSSDTFTLDGEIPDVGDLFIIGEVGSIVYDCIVKAITPQDNLTAVLTLVERAPELYNIESIDTIPGYQPRLSQTVDPNFSPPSEVEDLAVVENSYNILSSSYEYFIDVQWNPPANSAYEIFEVYVDDGGGFDLVAQTKSSEYRHIVTEDKLGVLHTFKVLAVSVSGAKLSLGEVTGVTATPLPKTTAPSDVLEFNSDITGEVIQLFWQKVPDLDIRDYLIRFSPALDATWEQSLIVQRVDSRTNLVAFQARVGSYFIKALDFNQNESVNAAVIISTIPALNNLNVIEETSDFPALTGSRDRVEVISNILYLQRTVIGGPGVEQFHSEGYYYFQNLLDLGEIYTVRLQALITAEGYTSGDIMSNWTTLSSVAVLSSVLSAAWDCELQYRTTDQLNVIAAWTTLSSIPLISGGSEDIWTAWRKFLVGDATGRIIQFRLKLISLLPNVSPRVRDAIVRADMPDRIESYNNLSAPDTGLVVTYTPSFKGPMPSPNVQITIENGESGDYWQFVSKTTDGFEIAFFDKTNNPVARIFDAQVKGYGREATSII